MRRKMKRLLAFILSVVMIFGIVPIASIDTYASESDKVYISISYDGEYMEDMCYVPVKISDIAKIDLETYGLDDYRYDEDGDGNDEITVLHLYVYVHTQLLELDWADVTYSGAAGSIFFERGIFGFPDCNLNYYVNGEYPLASEGWGATADICVLKAGDFIDVAGFSGWSFWQDTNAGFKYFTNEAGNITHSYTTKVNEAFPVTISKTQQDMTTGSGTILVPHCTDIYYSQTALDSNADYVSTDEDGSADITFDSVGTWYLWSYGEYGIEFGGDIVNAPAYAIVTVEAGEEPEPTNSAPVLKSEYNAVTETITLGDEYSITLSDIFEDSESNELIYFLNDAELTELTDSIYKYTPIESGTETLTFKAYDGQAYSPVFIVTLTVEEPQKEAAKLGALIIYTGKSSNGPTNSSAIVSDKEEHTDALPFASDILEYNITETILDTATATQILNFCAVPKNEADTITLYYANTEKNLNGTDGSYTRIEDILQPGKNIFTIVVSSNEENVESTTYTFNINVTPTLAKQDMTVESIKPTYISDALKGQNDLKGTIIVPKSLDKITLTVVPKNEDYTVTYNGSTSNIVDITNTDTVEIVVSKDGVFRSHTVTLTRIEEQNIIFHTIPTDADVVVTCNNGTELTPNADGSYDVIFYQVGGTTKVDKLTYTYIVSSEGYLSKTGSIGSFEGDNLEIDVTLENTLGPQPEEISDVDWKNFRNSDVNMGITSAQTPKKAAALRWTQNMGSGWGSAPSVPIIVDNKIIVMSGQKLYMLDEETGEIVKSVDMVSSPNFGYTPPTYAKGMIFCPLSNGTIQAFNATTLESLWVYKDALSGQSLSPITYSDGYIYTGFWNGESREANYVCLYAADEDTEQSNEPKMATWTHKQSGGFYWAGSVVVGDALIVGTDDGGSEGSVNHSYLYSFNKKTGEIISQIALEKAGDQRSSIAYDASTGKIYFTTKGGYLYSAAVNSNGEIGNVIKKNYSAQITSTPVVYNGRVYFGIGSGISTSGSTGSFVAADANTLETIFKIDLKGYPQSSALLSTAYENEGWLYFYSTYNNKPGGISLIKVKTNAKSATDTEVIEIYDAADYEEYCIASIICGDDGTLYYKNDSGNMFAVGAPSVANVEKLIDSIGTISLESKGPISAARGAYDSLSSSDKKTVSNYDKLLAAEVLYKEYERADAVDQKINAIGKVTLSSDALIKMARMAYETLSSSEKEKVTKLSVLTEAEAKLKELQSVDTEQIEKVEKLIDAIGQVTINAESRIKKARNAFNALTSEQKKLVSNFDDLLDAEDALEEARIQDVVDKIDSIGNVTLNSKAAINRARTAYNKLTESNKKKVTNFSLLEAAEKEYTELLKESKTTKKTTTTSKGTTAKTTTASTAENVSLNKITLSAKNLLENVTADSYSGEIFDAIMAYENLTDAEKFLLNKDYLVDELKTQFANKIQADETTGISVSGAEWNVQLCIEDVKEINEIQVMQQQITNGQMLGLWDISLEDYMTGDKHHPEEAVLIKIPLNKLGDFISYDGLVVVHYTEEATVEYLNCSIIGDSVVFNAIDFSNFAVVGYHGKSPVEGLVTGHLNSNSNALDTMDLTWVPWTITAAFGIALIVVLVILSRKTKTIKL